MLVFLLVVVGGWGAEDGVLRVAVLSDLHINLGPNPSCLGMHTQSNASVPTRWCDPPLSLVRG